MRDPYIWSISDSRQQVEKPLRRGRSYSLMDPNTTSAGSMQYDRWNEENIDMNVKASSQTNSQRIYSSVCNGSSGVAVKTAGALAALVSIYMIGYVTGYYVHRC
ncbi:hypothetical protein F7725_028021 [Dissostichus mawsoni]|uniref:Small integral membrane protein 1 n=1 Tax=Dissostichus mawsoni TaxID=36200 RepID=A0A7J5XF36_DISMA|nr:hypothetical protein F7725_028021 [Dissostichus mawsoni]